MPMVPVLGQFILVTTEDERPEEISLGPRDPELIDRAE